MSQARRSVPLPADTTITPVRLTPKPAVTSSKFLPNDTGEVSSIPEIEVGTYYVDVIDPGIFPRVASVEKEEIVVNDEGNQNEFRCPSKRCTRILKTEQALQKHKETHNKPAIFPCDICGKLLKSNKLVKKHKTSVHKVKLVFQCPHCEVTKNTEKRLDQHINMEHKPRFCHKCRQDFLTGRAFMVHNKNCGKHDRIGNRKIIR